ncbi:MAG: acyl--CoA ligase [Salinisphaera sp.]|nr:acyl--CoA ligase [Salinisphaera sp.]
MGRALGQMLVGALLENAAIRFPDAPALLCADTGRRFTFAELDARANRLAHAIEGLGIAKGDVLAFVVSNRAELIDIYFALARTGVIGIPVNYRLAAAEIRDLAQSMGAHGIIYEDRFAELTAPTAKAVQTVIRIGDAPPSDGEHDYHRLLDNASADKLDRNIREDDPYYFNLTSGTTGLPKSYLLSQYNNSTLGPFFQTFEMSRQDMVMTVFPAFGRVGVAWILAAIYYAIPNVLTNFEPQRALQLMDNEGVTIVNLVPTMAAMMLQARAAGAPRPDALRAIVFAGASLPQSVLAKTQENLCGQVYEYYGMQELGAVVVSTPEDRLRRPASQGKPILFADVLVVDDEGQPVPPGERGEVLGRTPGAVTAYFENPEKSAETFRDGWVHTGDLGIMDEQGYLTIVGRKKDMIVTGGQNVHASEVEDVLLLHPNIDDAAVFGLPHEMWGEQVTALLVISGDGPDDEALTAFCREMLAGFKIPKVFHRQSEALPRTPTGKVQKFLLVERFTD